MAVKYYFKQKTGFAIFWGGTGSIWTGTGMNRTGMEPNQTEPKQTEPNRNRTETTNLTEPPNQTPADLHHMTPKLNQAKTQNRTKPN